MNAVKILAPMPVKGELRDLNPFKKGDVLYKIVEGRKCNYLVRAIAGETRMSLQVYDDFGNLTKRGFVIDKREAHIYKIDVLATRLRQSYYEMKDKNDE